MPVILFEVEDLWTEAYLARFPEHSNSGIRRAHLLRAFKRFCNDPKVVDTQQQVGSTRVKQEALSLTGMPGHFVSRVPGIAFVFSLPGDRMFQTTRLMTDHQRPAIMLAYGGAKVGMDLDSNGSSNAWNCKKKAAYVDQLDLG